MTNNKLWYSTSKVPETSLTLLWCACCARQRRGCAERATLPAQEADSCFWRHWCQKRCTHPQRGLLLRHFQPWSELSAPTGNLTRRNPPRASATDKRKVFGIINKLLYDKNGEISNINILTWRHVYCTRFYLKSIKDIVDIYYIYTLLQSHAFPPKWSIDIVKFRTYNFPCMLIASKILKNFLKNYMKFLDDLELFCLQPMK